MNERGQYSNQSLDKCIEIRLPPGAKVKTVRMYRLEDLLLGLAASGVLGFILGMQVKSKG